MNGPCNKIHPLPDVGRNRRAKIITITAGQSIQRHAVLIMRNSAGPEQGADQTHAWRVLQPERLDPQQDHRRLRAVINVKMKGLISIYISTGVIVGNRFIQSGVDAT
jgi:hypothetical protein